MKFYEEGLKRDDWPSTATLDTYLGNFRARFSPKILAGLDGKVLLEYMHGLNNRDSLAYWLEFKNDEEFKTLTFGSIAGGTALKFRIYQGKTGDWLTGSPQKQRGITEGEAITFARRQRDELLECAKLVEQLPEDADDAAYEELQRNLNKVSPYFSQVSWGHKYLSLMYLGKLDDFHNPYYQRFYLRKVLVKPPEGDGRYICAGKYVAMAKETGIPMNHLTTILRLKYGRPYNYWRIDIDKAGIENNHWELMQKNNCVAISWPKTGDLSQVPNTKEGLNSIKKLVEAQYLITPPESTKAAQQIFYLMYRVNVGDVVVSSSSQRILGIGRVTGEYSYHTLYERSHQRPVQWFSIGDWDVPGLEEADSPLYQLTSQNSLIAVEKYLNKPTITPPHTLRVLTGILGRIQSVLERKNQVIIYGPPGTGKTYWAEKAALELASRSAFGKSYDTLVDEEKRLVHGDENKGGLVRMCTFHPAYGYEDFIEGYRPRVENGQMVFKVGDGIFKRICDDAAANVTHNYYLIIDEFNRGDTPRIFGELMTVLEKDKRNKPVLLPLSGNTLHVPPNVYVIGTMNTADKSISLLDAALRRRFGFVELLPDCSVLGDANVEGIPLGAWLDAINNNILENVGLDARNLLIGHTYLLDKGLPLKDFSGFCRVLREDIIPLLEEYCYDDYAKLEKILGSIIVDAKLQRINDDLFEEPNWDTLIDALMAIRPEITISPQAFDSSDEEDQPTG